MDLFDKCRTLLQRLDEADKRAKDRKKKEKSKKKKY